MTSLPASLLRGLEALAEPAVLRLLAKTVLLTLAVFVVAGIGGFYALDAGLTWAGLEEDYGLSALIATVLALLGAWLLFRIVALAVLQFFADEVVGAVERRSYPQAAATARKLGMGEEAKVALSGAGRALGLNLLALP